MIGRAEKVAVFGEAMFFSFPSVFLAQAEELVLPRMPFWDTPSFFPFEQLASFPFAETSGGGIFLSSPPLCIPSFPALVLAQT